MIESWLRHGASLGYSGPVALPAWEGNTHIYYSFWGGHILKFEVRSAIFEWVVPPARGPGTGGWFFTWEALPDAERCSAGKITQGSPGGTGSHLRAL